MSDSNFIVHLDAEDLAFSQNKKQVVFLPPHDRKPVLIFVYADWCGHCRNTKPAVIALNSYLKTSRVGYVVAVDADKNERLASMLGVDGFPSFFLVGKDDNIVRPVDVRDRSINSLLAALTSSSALTSETVSGCRK